MREHSFAQGEEYVENTYAINTATVAGQLIIHSLYRQIPGSGFVHSVALKAVKGNANDKHFNLYHDEECKEAADIELCIPVKKEIHHPLLTCRYLEAACSTPATHHESSRTHSGLPIRLCLPMRMTKEFAF